MTSSKWRPRSAAVGCAWFVALSTILTIFLSSKNLELAVENTETSNAYYNYAYKPAERKPQSRENEDDYNGSNDDVIDTTHLTEEPSVTSAGWRPLGQHGNITDSQFTRVDRNIVEDKIYWSPQVERLVPEGKWFTVRCNYE